MKYTQTHINTYTLIHTLIHLHTNTTVVWYPICLQQCNDFRHFGNIDTDYICNVYVMDPNKKKQQQKEEKAVAA